MKKLVIFVAVLCVLFASDVNPASLGLRSDNLVVDINFQPNFIRSYDYSVLTYDNSVRDIGIYVVDDNNDGTKTDISKYFKLSTNVIKNVDIKKEPYFTVTVNLPDKIDEPGTHKVRVGAVELIESSGGIGVRSAIEAVFYVHVPYQGKYMQYDLILGGVNVGEKVPYKLIFTNKGSEEIEKAYATLEMHDLNNNIVATATTNTINVASQDTKELTGTLDTEKLVAGSYSVNATIHYDGKESSIVKDVKIGDLIFEIVNQTDEIIAGKINKIDIEAESQWADSIQNVYADIVIAGKDKIRTVSEDFGGFERKTLSAFFDASDLKPGIYDMVTDLYFSGKSVEKRTKISVTTEGSIEFAKNLSVANILFVIIIVIILAINIVLLMILMKKKKEHENEKIGQI